MITLPPVLLIRTLREVGLVGWVCPRGQNLPNNMIEEGCPDICSLSQLRSSGYIKAGYTKPSRITRSTSSWPGRCTLPCPVWGVLTDVVLEKPTTSVSPCPTLTSLKRCMLRLRHAWHSRRRFQLPLVLTKLKVSTQQLPSIS